MESITLVMQNITRNSRGRVRFWMLPGEMELIRKVAVKACAMAKEDHTAYRLKEAILDIAACHCNGCPLRLAEMLEDKDGSFGHDVFGIRRFISRSTGKINPAKFNPRFAAHVEGSGENALLLARAKLMLGAPRAPVGGGQ